MKRGRQEENIFKDYVIENIISEYPEFLSVDLLETLTTKFKYRGDNQMTDSTIALIAAIASVAGAVIAGVSANLAYRFKRKDGKMELEKELNRIL